jgi:hypothetical protein
MFFPCRVGAVIIEHADERCRIDRRIDRTAFCLVPVEVGDEAGRIIHFHLAALARRCCHQVFQALYRKRIRNDDELVVADFSDSLSDRREINDDLIF